MNHLDLLAEPAEQRAAQADFLAVVEHFNPDPDPATIPAPYRPIEPDPLAAAVIGALRSGGFRTLIGELYFDWARGTVPATLIDEMGGWCG